MKRTTQTDRVLEILNILQKRGKISSSILKNKFDISIRTAQKDIAYVKKFLGDDALIKIDNTYELQTKDTLSTLLETNYTKIHKYSYSLSKIDSPILNELNQSCSHLKKVYLFLENPHEELSTAQKKLIKKIETYIIEKKYIHLKYKTDKEHSFRYVKPLKIVNGHENWYLASITTENLEVNNGFRLLRIQYITSISEPKVEPYNFHQDICVERFLKEQFKTLFTSFDQKSFTVSVRVSQKVARFFKAKRYLSSQKIISCVDPEIQKKHKFQNGDLLIEYSITQDMEILPIIQKFLPHVKVIEPKWLHEKVLHNIQAYLNT